MLDLLLPILDALVAQVPVPAPTGGGVIDLGPIHATKEAFESGGYGLAAVIFVAAVAAVSFLFKRYDTAKDALTQAQKDHADKIKQLGTDHAKELAEMAESNQNAMEKLRTAKDEQINTLTKATVDMVERQTKVMVEVSTQLQRMERIHAFGPDKRGAST